MYRMAPPEITIHFSRLPVPSDATTVENLKHLEDHLEESLQSLAQAKIKAVAFACTSGSFIKGPSWDRHLIERMEKIVSPATTTSESIISALKSLKVTNLALVTPYPDPINELMEAYLASQGYHVVNLKSLRLSSSSRDQEGSTQRPSMNWVNQQYRESRRGIHLLYRFSGNSYY